MKINTTQQIDDVINRRMDFLDRYAQASANCLVSLLGGFGLPVKYASVFLVYKERFHRGFPEFISDLELWHTENMNREHDPGGVL